MPGGQVEQMATLVAPEAELNCPPGQLRHTEATVAPSAELYVPPVHWVQAVSTLPSLTLYVPAPHWLHVVPLLYAPFTQLYGQALLPAGDPGPV